MRNVKVDKAGKFVMSEAAFTAQVIHLARLCGWMVAHFRPAMDRHGRWKTAVQGDGVGFPDLVLARKGRVMFIELKTDRGKLTEAQTRWLQELPGGQWHWWEDSVWRPSDWERIKKILTEGGREGA